jgi:hypothetical protein
MALFSCVAFETAAQANTCAGHLATIGADGGLILGSKSALLEAVRRGEALRVSWWLDPNNDGVPELVHWADAGFLSEWQGEVFAQLNDIEQQSPRRDPTRIEMPKGAKRWTGMLGSTGQLVGHFDDGSETISLNVRTTWCLTSCPPPSWRLVYHHDADGKPVAGRKEALLDGVRSGRPIRLAWGGSFPGGSGEVSVEHAAEPVFTSIMSGEVFAQLPEHIAQTSYFDPAKGTFETPSVMWRGLLGTNGAFDAVYVDRASGKEIRRLPQRARVAWFALITGQPACEAAVTKLAVPGGVRRSN